MKNASEYASKIKKLYAQLKRAAPKLEWPESEDPLDQLMIAVLSDGTSPAKARAALSRLQAHTVDLNDLRVSTPQELAGLIDNIVPGALERAAALVRVLNAIFEAENCMSLESLKSLGRREARAYLESLDGTTPYVTACTMLWGFGDHAIAVDEPLLEVLKKEDLIAADADLASAQSFLERHVPRSDARMFTLIMKRYAAQKGGRARPVKNAVKK